MNVVRRVREAVGSRWFSLGLQVAALEAFLLVAASLSWHFHAVSPPLVLGYGLIVVAAGSILLSPRWPVGAVGVALAAVLASHLLGYASSPIDLALMIALFKAASPEHVRRTVLLGIVTVLGYVAVQLIGTGTISVDALAFGTLTVSTFLVLGFAVASQRAFSRQRREEEMQRRVTDERLRIARELHDVVSHSISTINVQAGMAAHVIDHKPDEAKAALVTIKQTSRDTLRELRGILNVLRQVDEVESRQPAPGLAQLDVLVNTAARAGVPVSASVGGLARALPPADDQALVRAGFKVLLSSATDIEVVAEAANGEEAVSRAREKRPDVVLMDIRMPGVDGLEATRRIVADRTLAGLRVLILTTFEVDEYVFEALRSGASGFVVKDIEPSELLQAVRVVARGDALLSPTVTRRLIAEFAGRPEQRRVATAHLNVLTEREREVMALVAAGRNNDEIAAELYVSPATAKTHVSRAMSKLGARDRAQLVVLAYESGLVAPRLRPA